MKKKEMREMIDRLAQLVDPKVQWGREHDKNHDLYLQVQKVRGKIHDAA